MTLIEPLWLLAVLPLAVLIRSQRSDRPDRQRRRLLSVRGALLLLVALALAEPVITWNSRQLDVAIVVDVSASVEPSHLDQALQAIDRHLDDEGPVRLFAYADRAAAARNASDVRRMEVADSSTASANAGALDRGVTRTARSLRQVAATLRPDRVRRILLLSDGQDIRGPAREFGMTYPGLRVDAAALDRVASPVWIESVALDDATRLLHAGEAHSWLLRLGSRASLPAAPLTLRSGGKEVIRDVHLAPGVTEVELDWTFDEPGLQTLEVALGSGAGASSFQGALWRGRLRVLPRHRTLLLAPNDHSDDLERLLRTEGVDVFRSTPERAGISRAMLRGYDAVVLSNVAEGDLPEQVQRALGEWIEDDGGGLLFVAGEATFGEEGYRDSLLERVLPLDFEVEEERSEVALIIALDKSYSMKGPKMELAKEAAKAALGMLNEEHRFGLVAFDWHTHNIVPLQFVRDLERLQDRIDRIEASAQTNFYPALEAALDQLAAVDSEVRHVILVSDGRTYPDEYERLVLRMRDEKITVSTVAIGVESDRDLLADIALWGDGNAYTIEDPTSVQNILIDETMNQLPDSTREETIPVELHGQSEALAGIDIAAAPDLYGRIATVLKDSAELILSAGSGARESQEPILASRHVGLGKTWMFTSDLEPRWASDWMDWAELPQLVAQIVRDAADRRAGAEWDLRLHRVDDRLEAELSVIREDGRFSSNLAPRLALLRGDRRREATMKRTAPGLYRLDRAEDLLLTPSLEPYRVEVHTGPQGMNAAIGPGRTIFYPVRDELRPGAPDVLGLADFAAATGGIFHDTPEGGITAMTAPGNTTARRQLELWPALLGTATLLFLTELLLRRRRRRGDTTTSVSTGARARTAA